ncbi:MAG TPA: DNA-binding response regulator [Paenibacillaceae bacterium]|nr:DNA-binding response regulator [Paenibacillaceae bacterium]
MEQIKVIIIDDDSQWLKIITNFLNQSENILIVGTAQSKEEALLLLQSIHFDVALLDINLSDNNLDGIELVIEISNTKQCKIIMLTSLNDEEVIRDAFTAGAIHYISKLNYKEIPQIIHTIRNRTPYEVLLEDYYRLKKEEQLKNLTRAEREIFDLVEQGLTHAEIKDRLYKTERTLKNQVNHILKKLGTHSCREAIVKVMRRGL